MCTITFVPTGSRSFILCSNRDEDPRRTTLAPAVHDRRGTRMIYPKDLQSGGSWIGSSETQRTACIMNGARKPHERTDDYKTSRGVILKEVLTADRLDTFIKNYDLNGIEPFTMLVVCHKEDLQLFQWTWDGNKYLLELLPTQPMILQSSMIYSQEEMKRRKGWFETLAQLPQVQPAELWKWHHAEDDLSQPIATGARWKRDSLQTVSVTMVEVNGEVQNMHYHDLQTNLYRSVDLIECKTS